MISAKEARDTIESNLMAKAEEKAKEIAKLKEELLPSVMEKIESAIKVAVDCDEHSIGFKFENWMQPNYLVPSIESILIENGYGVQTIQAAYEHNKFSVIQITW